MTDTIDPAVDDAPDTVDTGDETPARPRPPWHKDPMFYAGIGLFGVGLFVVASMRSRRATTGCADCAKRHALRVEAEQAARARQLVDDHIDIQQHQQHAGDVAGATPEPEPTPPAPHTPVAAPAAATPEPATPAAPAGHTATPLDVHAIGQLPSTRAGLTALPTSS